MNSTRRVILVADDNEEDRRLIREAALEGLRHCSLQFVQDGDELLTVLRQAAAEKEPDLILLDLNMPRKDGRATLLELKSDPRLKQIPVVMMTASFSEKDIQQTYALGVNSYIVKPITFEELVEILKIVENYWMQVVRLPSHAVPGE